MAQASYSPLLLADSSPSHLPQLIIFSHWPPSPYSVIVISRKLLEVGGGDGRPIGIKEPWADVNEKLFTIACNLSSYSLIHEKNTKIFVYELWDLTYLMCWLLLSVGCVCTHCADWLPSGPESAVPASRAGPAPYYPRPACPNKGPWRQSKSCVLSGVVCQVLRQFPL